MSKSKQKGTAAETAVVRYLRSIFAGPNLPAFPNVERRALSGGKDMGDVAGIPGWIIEVKAAETLKLAEWQRETLTEKANANANYCLLVVKRKYKPIHQWDAYAPAKQLGYPSAFMPEGEEWVRMDLVLAVSYMALRANL